MAKNTVRSNRRSWSPAQAGAESQHTCTTGALATVTHELQFCLQRVSEDLVTQVVTLVREHARVFVHGAGRSGLIARCFAQRLRHLGIESWVVGETVCPPAGAGDLFIAVSCSGRTATTAALLDTAAAAGCHTLAITAHPSGRIARKAAARIVLPECCMNQPGNAVFEQITFLFFEAVAADLFAGPGMSREQTQRRHTNLE